MSIFNIWPYIQPVNSTGIALDLPPQTVNASCRLTFLGDGRLDFNDVLTQLQREYSRELGVRVVFVPKALQDPEFMETLKDLIVVQSILVTRDILTMFTPVKGSMTGSGDGCRLTLMMKNSNYLVQVPIRRDAKGGYDVEAVIAALEQSYREVMFMDSQEVIFSADQRRVMREGASEWLDGLLAAEGISPPEVIVDTENVEWQDKGLLMKVRVSASESVGVAGREYSLTVPFMQGGNADYSDIEPLAKKISAEWLKENPCLCSEAVYKSVQEPLREVVPAYVEWVIAEIQKDVQRFWDAFNAELKKKKELVKKFEKEAEEYVEKIKSETLEEAKRPEPGVINGLIWAFPRVFRGLFEAAPKISEGLKVLLDQAPRHISANAEEMMKALEFGFKAAGVIIWETGWMVMWDVGVAYLGNKIPFWSRKYVSSVKKGDKLYRFVSPLKKSAQKTGSKWDVGEFIFSRLIAGGQLTKNLYEAKDRAEEISQSIIKIKNQIYGEK